MQVGDLVVRNPAYWDGGLDDIGIVIGYDENDDERVTVQWIDTTQSTDYSVYDLELYHEVN